ncbi:MAG: tetratricopeptide (TPR) repeat protein [Pirellulaceae bacterium]|jgi:tetratricopeptide (TPR) repeat protein
MLEIPACAGFVGQGCRFSITANTARILYLHRLVVFVARMPYYNLTNKVPHCWALFAAAVMGLAGCHAFPKSPAVDSVARARQLSLQATEATQDGQWDNAEQLYREAIEACPEDERAHFRYAETLWRRGATDEALAHMEKAVQLSGGAPDLRIRLGSMYFSRGQLNEAAEQAELAIAANRKIAAAWALQGDIHRKFDRDREALSSYHRALCCQSHYPAVQLATAEIYRRNERHQRALATANALAEHYPVGQVPQPVLVEQGLAMKSLGQLENAIERFRLAASQSDPSAEAMYHLSETLLLSGNVANARLAVAEALDRWPHHKPTQRLRGQIEEKLQHMAQATIAKTTVQ